MSKFYKHLKKCGGPRHCSLLGWVAQYSGILGLVMSLSIVSKGKKNVNRVIDNIFYQIIKFRLVFCVQYFLVFIVYPSL